MPFASHTRSKIFSRWAAAAAATVLSVAAFAASPGLHEVYQAAEAGHVEQAQQMMDQVLREHPDSAKAYYVRAELYARQGRGALAQQALAQAERLEPGLPFADAKAVRALRERVAELSSTPSPARSATTGATTSAMAAPQRTSSGVGAALPWLAAAGLAVVALLLWRRRPRPEPRDGIILSGGTGGYAPGGMPGYAPSAPSAPYPAAAAPSGGGLGAGIAGGLATGVAVGAGAVAGQMLMQRMLGGGEHAASSGGLFSPSAADRGNLGGALGDPTAGRPLANDDMGGSDFGVADAGSWDDGGGGGGGDDWN